LRIPSAKDQVIFAAEQGIICLEQVSRQRGAPLPMAEGDAPIGVRSQRSFLNGHS
jgi:hypothetical protein